MPDICYCRICGKLMGFSALVKPALWLALPIGSASKTHSLLHNVDQSSIFKEVRTK